MTEVVLDASVVLKWFGFEGEAKSAEARALRKRYEQGDLVVTVPSLLFLELLNVAGRRWSWDEGSLQDLAAALDDLAFDVGEAELTAVAAWVARGLTAYDAAYVALAEGRRVGLITDDGRILEVAGAVASPLAAHN
ncbi:MAG: type II toxin-antitoxin system VapC family toxin [Actinomycetota bacterium]